MSKMILTEVNSKSFWLARLRMYSSLNWLAAQARWTGGVRVVMAATIVWKEKYNLVVIKPQCYCYSVPDEYRPFLQEYT